MDLIQLKNVQRSYEAMIFVSYCTLIKNPTRKHQTNGYIMLLLYINVI